MLGMSRADEYARQAEEAERAAETALSPLDRDSYNRVAQGWRELETAARIAEKRGV